jgi:hypothetical protein
MVRTKKSKYFKLQPLKILLILKMKKANNDDDDDDNDDDNDTIKSKIT